MIIDKNTFTEPLLNWYHKSHRQLPWREETCAYHIWISEIMLQQTRVETVKNYYERFMKDLPTVYDLAEVDLEKLLKLWEGLGYYSRAKNLKKSAEIIVKNYNGVIPNTYDDLIKLPGIGDYTAGAILAIAYNQPYPALDGNVLRVLTRVFEISTDVFSDKGKEKMKKLLFSLLPDKDNTSFAQSLMELGAMICIPNGDPHCQNCPLQTICQAHLNNNELCYPIKKQKSKRKIERYYVLLITHRDKVLIQKRTQKGLLADFYEFPNFSVEKGETEFLDDVKRMGLEIESIKKVGNFKHIFTHLEWHMIGYHIEVKNENQGLWVNLKDLKDIYPIPTAFLKYQEQLEKIIKDKI